MTQETRAKRAPQSPSRDPGEDAGNQKPMTPQEEFMNDIVISMRQVRDGEVCDLEESLRQIENELGISRD